MRAGIIYTTRWKGGIYCTFGKELFFPQVKIILNEINIPFAVFDDLMMERFEGTFEEASMKLCNQIATKYCREGFCRVEIGDDKFIAFCERP